MTNYLEFNHQQNNTQSQVLIDTQFSSLQHSTFTRPVFWKISCHISENKSLSFASIASRVERCTRSSRGRYTRRSRGGHDAIRVETNISLSELGYAVLVSAAFNIHQACVLEDILQHLLEQKFNPKVRVFWKHGKKDPGTFSPDDDHYYFLYTLCTDCCEINNNN